MLTAEAPRFPHRLRTMMRAASLVADVDGTNIRKPRLPGSTSHADRVGVDES